MIDPKGMLLKDEFGSLVFYPWLMGRGYIIERNQQREDIESSISSYNKFAKLCFFAFPLVGVAGGYFDLDEPLMLTVIFVLLVIVGFVYHFIYIVPVTKNMQRSHKAVSWGNAIKLQVLALSMGLYVCMTAFFLIMQIALIFLNSDTYTYFIPAAIFAAAGIYKYKRKSLV